MTEPDDASDTTPVPLLGGVTGYAKEVVRNIRRAAVSAQMKDFLLEVYDRSFSNAGFQRRAGLENPGGSCPFDNASWASELGLRRQHMYRLRKRAEELGILFHDEGASDRSCGRLRWNLAFDQWVMDEAAWEKAHGLERYPRRISPPDADVLRWLEALWAGDIDGGSGRLPLAKWMALRDSIFDRDGFRCAYCGATDRPLHCDHIIPLSRGGTNVVSNLVTACQDCNLAKSNKTLEEWQAGK